MSYKVSLDDKRSCSALYAATLQHSWYLFLLQFILQPEYFLYSDSINLLLCSTWNINPIPTEYTFSITTYLTRYLCKLLHYTESVHPIDYGRWGEYSWFVLTNIYLSAENVLFRFIITAIILSVHKVLYETVIFFHVNYIIFTQIIAFRLIYVLLINIIGNRHSLFLT